MANEEPAPASEPQPVGHFEEGLNELEKIVKEMETGEPSLERSMELFEKGMELSENCRKMLVEAETRVEAIVKKQGKYQTEPFRPAK